MGIHSLKWLILVFPTIKHKYYNYRYNIRIKRGKLD
jgi:hypothetical protein